jgi:hypothetical protein
MQRSDSITDLAVALAKAQGEIEGAKKGSENPHFRSKYADLAAVWDAIREPLAKYGLAVVQVPRLIAGGENSWLVEVESTLLHATGQFVGDTLALPLTRVDAQGVGSAITYARRYALMALVGVAPEDDDGEAAVGTERPPAAKRAPAEVETTTIKILGIVERRSGSTSKFLITATDRVVYHTFNRGHAETAKSAQEAGLAVTMQYRQEDYGRALISIAEVTAEDPVL